MKFQRFLLEAITYYTLYVGLPKQKTYLLFIAAWSVQQQGRWELNPKRPGSWFTYGAHYYGNPQDAVHYMVAFGRLCLTVVKDDKGGFKNGAFDF